MTKRMHTNTQSTAGAVLGVALLAASTLQAELVDWGDPIDYRVTITTSLDIPKSEGATRVRVIHSLPVENIWSKGDKNSAARNISSSPQGGRIKRDRELGGSYVAWEERVPRAGGKFEFSTTYETTSARRWPSEQAVSKARWKSRTVEKVEGAHPEILQQAELLIKEGSPIEAFKKFSAWLKGRIAYDASVPNEGVDDTMANGAGHCGHFAGVMLQFAKTLGVEAKASGGANLRAEDGGTNGPLFSLRPTWSNTHAWVELNLPGVGWVEAEPTGGEDIFQIPERYVKTRGVTQNYRVEILKDGKWQRTEWVAKDEGKGFTSPVGERNVISFSVVGGGDKKMAADTGDAEEVGGAGGMAASSGTATEDEPGGASRPQADAGVAKVREARLTQRTAFHVKHKGFVVGTVTVPAGGAVEVLDQDGERVLVKRGASEAKWVSAISLDAPL